MVKLEELADKELRANIAEYEKNVPKELLARWKNGQLSNEAYQFAKRMIAGVTTGMYRRLFPDEALPDWIDALYWFPFRYSVAIQALTLKWIVAGGYLSVKSEKLRNDTNDMSYVAYGTCFDGVLTNDVKLLELSAFASEILRREYGLTVGCDPRK